MGLDVLSYFNRAAFAQPAAGTLGDLPRNAAVGPDFWNVDLAVSKLVAVTGTHPIAANLAFSAGTFGRITTQTGTPRIIQFGIKYDF